MHIYARDEEFASRKHYCRMVSKLANSQTVASVQCAVLNNNRDGNGDVYCAPHKS